MNKLYLLIIFIFFHELSFSQYDFYQNFSDNSDDNYIKTMVSTFEELICDYYSIEKDKSQKAYKLYLQEISKEKVNFPSLLAKLSSEKSLQLLKQSYEELADYVWLKSSDNRHKFSHFSFTLFTPEELKKFKDEQFFEKYINKIKSKKFVYIINYEEEFSDKLISISNNNDIKDFILTFREDYISTPLLIAPMLNLKEQDFKNQAIKTFIAFELFYTCLNSKIDNE
ncbi:hypothetical protein BTO06_03095 [Tenacibaculum sp. SZ-18]|uniref:hypothetical protein n=1 Tax=Tenacibaculum sp. SZ-18 TaxID=754423 RepID=UPI000C2CE922|nr:hypothetical protein [Tenacibaculum sp. SZ-18]AUC14196.1 hypothetical protein BTO06_03095 [Tenacibaculum sp. SZ-18]